MIVAAGAQVTLARRSSSVGGPGQDRASCQCHGGGYARSVLSFMVLFLAVVVRQAREGG